MAYRIDYKQLAEHWKLDEWPDEIIVYHQLTPNSKRVYAPKRTCHVESVPIGTYDGRRGRVQRVPCPD